MVIVTVLLTANPLLSVACVVTFIAFILLLWRRSEVPILLFCCAYQWLQVAGKVFYANVLGVSVVSIDTYRSYNGERAIWYGLTGLVCLALGMRLSLTRWEHRPGLRLVAEGAQVRIPRIFAIYLAATILSIFGAWLRYHFASVGQVVVPFLLLKWVFFYVLAYTTLKRGQGRQLLAFAVILEVVLGLGSYFSGFKTVFFLLALVIPVLAPRLSPRRIMLGFVAATMTLTLALVWMGVRAPYRAYLNQGTSSQVTLVSWPDRLKMMSSLVGQLDQESLQVATQEGLRRLAYTDIFARVLAWVPAVRPHEGGRIWRAAIANILVPRVLNPNKPPLPSDSDLTIRYSGVLFAGAAQGTSVSMGYMAESYVDFGVVGMFVTVTLLGVLWGFIYRFVLSRGRIQLLSFGLAVAVLLDASQFEIASVKLLGGVLTKFIILAVVLPIPLRWSWRWISAQQAGASVPVRLPARALATSRRVQV